MATFASDEVRWIAEQIVNQCGYASAVLSGIIPDKAHLTRGGFHCSVQDLLAHGNGGDYSNTRAADKGFNPQYGAALDVSMSKTDMIRAHGRIRAVWADTADPRRKYLNAVNCWDGSGDAVRYDFDAGTAKYASPDHKWHNHIEVHRRWVRDAKAARAVVSTFKGEPKSAWIAREEEDDMALSAEDKAWISATIVAKTQQAIDARLAAIGSAVVHGQKMPWSVDDPKDPKSYQRDLADLTGDAWSLAMRGRTRGGGPVPVDGVYGRILAELDELSKQVAALTAKP